MIDSITQTFILIGIILVFAGILAKFTWKIIVIAGIISIMIGSVYYLTQVIK